jgi:N6-L-threonylcarbamoyladenine synthase
MRILSIETSCDETAVSIVEVTGDFPDATYTLLGNSLFSQIDIHKEFGGVFPTVAKREHIKTILPMLKKALEESELLVEQSLSSDLEQEKVEKLHTLLLHEAGLADDIIAFATSYELPTIDLIAVTSGPGLEPALWVGVNFAKALSLLLSAPVVPVNHMEGHIFASVYDAVEEDKLAQIAFPALALLISGGHTELIVMKDWTLFEKVGQTKDDAVGEAFDKVARMMGLSYPGGPEVGARAKLARTQSLPPFKTDMPRPMLHSGDLDFSFSGIKTSVKYAIADKELTEDEKNALARDFEDAVTEVLLKKTQTALTQFGAQTLIVGGGVSASTHIRDTFTKELLATHPDVEVYFPQPKLSTDNSIMIALAGHAHHTDARTAGAIAFIRADGNRSL